MSQHREGIDARDVTDDPHASPEPIPLTPQNHPELYAAVEEYRIPKPNLWIVWVYVAIGITLALVMMEWVGWD
jgi:hypothetical protein